jgi:hypothetical protein
METFNELAVSQKAARLVTCIKVHNRINVLQEGRQKQSLGGTGLEEFLPFLTILYGECQRQQLEDETVIFLYLPFFELERDNIQYNE